jgi:hypothetical protein
MKNTKLLVGIILGIAIIAIIGFGLNPIQKIASAHAYNAQINPMPTEEWFHLDGITLKPGDFWIL